MTFLATLEEMSPGRPRPEITLPQAGQTGPPSAGAGSEAARQPSAVWSGDRAAATGGKIPLGLAAGQPRAQARGRFPETHLWWDAGPASIWAVGVAFLGRPG